MVLPLRRRAVAVVLALVLGSLAACSSGDDDAAEPSRAPVQTNGTATTTGEPTNRPDLPDCPVDALEGADGPVRITVWHSMAGANDETLQAMTADYNASQDRVRVQLVNQVSYEDTIEKYRTSSSNERPVVVQMPEYALQLLVDSRTVLPVQSCVEAEGYDTSDFLEKVVNHYTIADVLWPMPFNVSNPVLFYNKQVFERAGLDPERPPATLEELRTMSEQIVSSGAATYGFAVDTDFDAGGGWFIEQWFAKAGELFADNENGRAAPATQVLFDNELGLQVVEFLDGMVEDGLAINVGANPSGQDTLLRVADANQPAAMTVFTSAALASIVDVLEAGTFPNVTLGVGPMPGPSGAAGAIVGGAAFFLVAERSDEQTAAGWDFVKWMAEPEQQARWAAGTGYIPARESAAELPEIQTLWEEHPEFRVAFDQLIEGPTNRATAGAILGPHLQIRRVLAEGLERVYRGDIEPADMLAEAAQEANEILADYARRSGR